MGATLPRGSSWGKRASKPGYFTDTCTLAQPFDFAALAKAFGVHGARVEKAEDIGPALQAALDSGGPAVIDMIVDGAV